MHIPIIWVVLELVGFTLRKCMFSALNQRWRKFPNTKTNSLNSKRKRRSSTSETNWKSWRKKNLPWKKKTKRFDDDLYYFSMMKIYDIACFFFFTEKTRLVQKGRRKEGKRRRNRGLKTSHKVHRCTARNELHIFTQFYLFSLFYVLSTPACNCY